MNRQIKKMIMPVLALSILLLMMVWLAGGFNDKVAPELLVKEDRQTIAYTEVQPTTVETYEPIAASVTAKEATIISARTMARIEAIKVRAGDKVSQGQLLVSLEKQDSQAQVAQASQRVKAVDVRLAEAKKNLQRSENLRQKNLVAEFAVDKEQANVDALEAELSAAKQALTHANSLLSYHTLKSPIDGTVIDRFAEPGDTAQPGRQLLTLYNPNTLRISAQVREHLAITLTRGQQIKVELPSINQTLLAQVEEIVPAANVGSRSFLVNLTIPAEPALLPGMYAKLLLPTGTKQAILLAPEQVGSVGQLTMVSVLEHGQPQRRFIRVAAESNADGKLEVISGLTAGDKVLN